MERCVGDGVPMRWLLGLGRRSHAFAGATRAQSFSAASLCRRLRMSSARLELWPVSPYASPRRGASMVASRGASAQVDSVQPRLGASASRHSQSASPSLGGASAQPGPGASASPRLDAWTRRAASAAQRFGASAAQRLGASAAILPTSRTCSTGSMCTRLRLWRRCGGALLGVMFGETAAASDSRASCSVGGETGGVAGGLGLGVTCAMALERGVTFFGLS
mmetsp:Transcript_28047/g.96525  ORF Transcript_28047/g.96525 Transcript_28047/m.96525 type:complete len:221 (-) Transcript_28047:177-839(-)